MDETTTSKIANAEDAGVPALPVKPDAPPEETAAQPEQAGPPPLHVADAAADQAAADQADDSQLRTMVEEQGFVAAPMPEVHPTEGPGGVEIFYNTQLPEEKRMAYIMLLATDSIVGFDAKTLHPYAAFMSNTKLGGGGWKRRLSPNKDLVVSELKRRDPTKRPNKSNRGADEIVGMWEKLDDPRDIAFIKMKEAELRGQMSLLLEQDKKRKENPTISNFRAPRSTKRVKPGDPVGPGGHLESDLAETILAAAQTVAVTNGWGATVAIVDGAGNPILIKRVLNAYPASFELALAKAKASAQYGKPTGNILECSDIPRGGSPLIIDNYTVGAIGVAGQKSTTNEIIANAGVTALSREIDPDNAVKVDVAQDSGAAMDTTAVVSGV
mmetsp:Transcript_9187/g.21342  ORF Transcript_9187/g.21342 Transcript_9187/m.21342 type:complete len:384 (+) Transcript_9187:119-1270(+)